MADVPDTADAARLVALIEHNASHIFEVKGYRKGEHEAKLLAICLVLDSMRPREGGFQTVWNIVLANYPEFSDEVILYDNWATGRTTGDEATEARFELIRGSSPVPLP